jgi:cyclophilin family peptidyl-prolyl cis-trans isomerase
MLRSFLGCGLTLAATLVFVSWGVVRAADSAPSAGKPNSGAAKAEQTKPPADAAKPAADPAAKPAEGATAKSEPKPKDESKADTKPPTAAKGEPAKDKPAAATAKPAATGASPAEVFAKKLAEWKDVFKELRKLRADFQTAAPDKVGEIQTKWNELIAKGETLIPELRAAGTQAFVAEPNKDQDLARFLVGIVANDVARDDYEPAAELSQTLLQKGCDEKGLYEPAAIAAFATNDFDKADEYFKKAKEKQAIGDAGKKYVDEVEKYKGYWEDELELRGKEEAQGKQDEKKALPRVELATSKGKITIELFENEAPGAVGNFISLVEKGFYNGLVFHRVLPGFMAQGGCPKGDGTGGPGYNIYCECSKEPYRKHFRGTLSMAHAGPNTGGSQFFLTFLPTPHLNGKHTAFGRVVEGMDVLAKLQRIDPQGKEPKPTPDKIVEAKVIRKRPHAYEPNKVK